MEACANCCAQRPHRNITYVGLSYYGSPTSDVPLMPHLSRMQEPVGPEFPQSSHLPQLVSAPRSANVRSMLVILAIPRCGSKANVCFFITYSSIDFFYYFCGLKSSPIGGPPNGELDNRFLINYYKNEKGSEPIVFIRCFS